MSGDSWDDVERTGSGTLTAVYVPSGGFAYQDDDGWLTGVTVEIVRAFAQWVEEEHDVSVEIDFVEEPDWARFYRRVRDAGDGVIGMGNVTITGARQEELLFSPPYLNNIAVLISHEDRPELEAMEDIPEVFGDHIGLMYPGTLHEQRMEAIREEYLPEMDTDTVTSNDEIMERVSSEDRYFTYVDVYNLVIAQERGAPLKRHAVADDAAEEFGYIMPHGSSWHPLVVDFFEQDGGFVQSERYREILTEHVGEQLAEMLLDE